MGATQRISPGVPDVARVRSIPTSYSFSVSVLIRRYLPVRSGIEYTENLTDSDDYQLMGIDCTARSLIRQSYYK